MRQPSNENPPVVSATDGLRESDPTETTLETAPAATAGNPPLGSQPLATTPAARRREARPALAACLRKGWS